MKWLLLILIAASQTNRLAAQVTNQFDPAIDLKYAEQLYRQGQLQPAQQELNKILLANPTNAEAIYYSDLAAQVPTKFAGQVLQPNATARFCLQIKNPDSTTNYVIQLRR